MHRSEQGLLVVLSGPSGSGKDTVLGELGETVDDLELSVSLTSRERRPWEFDGTHYYFVTREYFEEKLRAGEILEHTQYVNGHYYGTPKGPVDEWLALGKTVILKIEVEGAARIRAIYPDCVSVFLLPPSLEALERRLFGRESENAADIARRTEIARREIARAGDYDYVILNDVLDCAVDDLRAVLRAERRRAARRIKLIEEVLKSC
ncbi:MAG: guanylate kinase [Oscillospiraceae bacterium]|nr:guanylate kinase [Oscillospiraceae bacterium]